MAVDIITVEARSDGLEQLRMPNRPGTAAFGLHYNSDRLMAGAVGGHKRAKARLLMAQQSVQGRLDMPGLNRA
ncbi:hypothetical protein A0H81_01113 [Grifola frondosa]|uniref:Uncharacterized protein n=1 Tax=Grifola frondosa TaxID=5627 RepID=A0A1C7MTD6_GRIFR|nr:hypothetical protein A0H81_01113 [Grifola frondosa]